MPLARIEVRKSWPAEKQQFLIQALHAAMLGALKIPERDKQIRFVESSFSNVLKSLSLVTAYEKQYEELEPAC